MKEIREMFTELKNQIAGIIDKSSNIISELRTSIGECEQNIEKVYSLPTSVACV